MPIGATTPPLILAFDLPGGVFSDPRASVRMRMRQIGSLRGNRSGLTRRACPGSSKCDRYVGLVVNFMLNQLS